MINNNRILSGFFVIYFTISIFDAYFIIYIPLYYLNIIDVNQTELAFIQSITYLTLFVTPGLGLYYDKFVNKTSISKAILYICYVTLTGSFLIFILYKEIILIYGIFVFIYFFSKSMIRTIMTRLFLEVVEESKKLKLNIILFVNTATIGGYLVVSLIFNFNVLNITSTTFWDKFFIFGWFSSVLIIFIGIILSRKIKFLKESINLEEFPNKLSSLGLFRYELFIIGIIYFSYILATSDLLVSYPLSSWIFNKFTEKGFRFYSSLYFIFFMCSILGLYLSNQLCKKYNEKKLMCIFIYLYIILLLPITISNFPIFMILNSGLSVIASSIATAYTSLVTDFSNKGRYRTFKYQFLQTSTSISNIVFIPLGTLYFGIINVETLIIISGILIGISGILILLTFPIDKRIGLGNQTILDKQDIQLMTE